MGICLIHREAVSSRTVGRSENLRVAEGASSNPRPLKVCTRFCIYSSHNQGGEALTPHAPTPLSPRFQRSCLVREGEDIEAGWKAKDVQRGVKGGLLGSICLDRTPPPPPRRHHRRRPRWGYRRAAAVFQYFPNQANNRSQGNGWKIAVSDRQ